MKKTGHLTQWALVGFCLVLSGCVNTARVFTPPTAPLASELSDAEAKRFKSQPGQASIYVIRENRFAGQAFLFPVSLDGNARGNLARGTYFLFTVPPGKHVIDVNKEMGKGTETVYAVDGGIYYLEIRPKSARVPLPADIFRIDQKRGKELVLGGRRAVITKFD